MSRRGLSWAASIGVIAALGGGACDLTRDGGDDAVEPTSDDFARLAERPRDLPRDLASGDGCELTVDAVKLPGIPGEAALAPVRPGQSGEASKGPIYASLGGVPRGTSVLDPPSGGAWGITETLWISDPSYTGPVLVRGGQLDARNRIRFGAGRNPQPELRLGEAEWQEDEELRHDAGPVRPRQRWRVAAVTVRLRATGCYAFQVDGHGFSYTLPFFATFLDE